MNCQCCHRQSQEFTNKTRKSLQSKRTFTSMATTRNLGGGELKSYESMKTKKTLRKSKLTNDDHNGSEDVVPPWIEDGLKFVGHNGSRIAQSVAVGQREIAIAIIYGIVRFNNRHDSLNSTRSDEVENFRPLRERNVE